MRRFRLHGAAALRDQDDVVQVAMDMRADRPFAGTRPIVQTFDMYKAFRHAALRFAIEVEAGDGRGHDGSSNYELRLTSYTLLDIMEICNFGALGLRGFLAQALLRTIHQQDEIRRSMP
jgi:hypothetical protein